MSQYLAPTEVSLQEHAVFGKDEVGAALTPQAVLEEWFTR